MLKKLIVKNFLSLNEGIYVFDNINKINEEGLKSFFILKYLITLSDTRPDLVTLIDNEKRPNRTLPLSFEIEVNLDNFNYQYFVSINNNSVFSEYLKIDNQLIFMRDDTKIILNNEVITWNCPNQKHKVFLDACATKADIKNDILYFFKENILSITKITTNPLNDDIKKLFKNEPSSLTPLIENIIIYNQNYLYGDSLEKLNLILKENNSKIKPFTNNEDIELNNFLQLNINLSWLIMIGGGILFLDKSYLSYINYLTDFILIHKDTKIQIVFLD